MKIVFFGLSLTSSWGNGHASTYRSLIKALSERGHRCVFFERNVEWYASNRDLPKPAYCRVRLYKAWPKIKSWAESEIRDAEVVVLGSYCAEGSDIADWLFETNVPVKVYYDIDTPVTITNLRAQKDTFYLRSDQLKWFDLVLSFTGGRILRELERQWGVKRARPFYCSVDPDVYHRRRTCRSYACDLGYMGTYAESRHEKLKTLLIAAARKAPRRRFLIAGPQYPDVEDWPTNVRYIPHLSPREHPSFYSSNRVTLNITRQQMVDFGFSPAVRIFEAAACATPIASDWWEGIEDFFKPGEEVIILKSTQDTIQLLNGYDNEELRRIGRRGRERILSCHTNRIRAAQFERFVAEAAEKHRQVAGIR